LRRRWLGTELHRWARLARCGLAATTLASVVAVVAAPGPAQADQVTDKKAQAAALAQKINADARQVEVLAEQYNGAQYHLAAVQQQMAAASQHLAAAQAAADRDRAALGAEAVLAYMHGGVTAAPTTSSFTGSVDFSVQQGYFQLATGDQAQALDQLRQSQRELRVQQQALQSAEADSKAALTAVSSRQQAVQAAANATQTALGQVQGDLVSLVAQQQAQIAAQQQAQVKPALISTQAKLNSTGVAAVAAPPPSTAATTGGSSPSPTAAPSTTAATRSPSTGGPTTTPPTTSAPKPPPPPAPPPSSGAAAALAYARAQLGKPYQWAGSGPNSFDCSGLTMMAWAAGGVSLPHLAAGQYANTAHVPIADLRPGDLVFFGSDLHHVGIYVGGGEMIHAPQTGEVVSYSNIFWPDLQPYGGRPG
jgi:cell wall-associated NlpC family hydrolase